MTTMALAINSMRRSVMISMLACIFLPMALVGERLLFLGDSLTAGYGLEPDQAYPQLVEVALRARGREVTVVNAGLSGDTSAGGLRRMDWILRQSIDTLVVALGANDALRGLPVDTTRENLRGIIHAVRAKQPEVRIILAGMLAPPNMGAAYRDSFARLFPELARSESVELLPFLLEGVAGVPSLNLADGIHPNVEGQKRVAELVLCVLDRH